MSKINQESQDQTVQNIESLKQLFPEVFISGKLNFDTLQELLGEEVEEQTERYGLSWNGKNQAKRIVKQTTTSTLIPDKTQSVEWDKTKNVFIEGDNLEVLKALQRSYNKQVKMIYIDPPYNTGKDFVYADNFNDNLQNYLEYTGQVDEAGRKLSTNPESDGRYHDKWLSMMYPRLKLAKNLLRDDGVIFISIDDHEVQNLRYLCDEVFGSDNFLAQIIWRKKYGIQNDAKYFSNSHEYILCYCKNYVSFDGYGIKSGFEIGGTERTDEQNARYSNPDNDPRGVWTSGDISVRTYNKDYDYPITTPTGIIINPPNGRCWRTSKEKFSQLVHENRIYFSDNGNGVPRLKRFITEVKQTITPTTFWDFDEVGHTDGANKALKSLFNDKSIFDFPKPLDLVSKCISLANDKNSIILDFFAGSGTIAQAVMELNAKDGGNRKFICVQLPEPIEEGKSEQKEAYDYCVKGGLELNIASLTKERIKKAGEKIKREYPLEFEGMDLGFRTFKLGDTNFVKWDKGNTENLEGLFKEMDKQVEIKNLDIDSVLFETLLKEGVDLALTPEMSILEIGGNKVCSFENGLTLVCLDSEIKPELFTEILKLDTKPTKVICLESGFVTDEIKINGEHLMTKNNIKFKTI